MCQTEMVNAQIGQQVQGVGYEVGVTVPSQVVEVNQVSPPPLPPIPDDGPGRAQRVNSDLTNSSTHEANPQSGLLASIVQMMKSTMERQDERIRKLLEDRDANTRSQETGINSSGKTCSFKTFLYSKPLEFSGTDNPVVCVNWIQEMEQAFDTSECEEG